MKTQFKQILTLISTAMTLQLATLKASAHEGHDHDAPATVAAPKGGQLKAIEDNYVEVLAKGKDVKIYIYNKDLKAEKAAPFKVTAQIEMPRSKKKESLQLTDKETYLEASFDAKGAHRYTLILSLTPPNEGHEDQIKFTIEPKR